jgi:hypothetical protein
MGWFNVGTVAGGLTGGLVGAAGGSYLGSQLGSAPDASPLNNNQALQDEVNANQMAAPTPLDPNSIPSNIPGLSQKQNYSGPSTWDTMEQNNNAAQTTKAEGDAGAQANAGTATARAQLAKQGGLTGGAAERLARAGSQDTVAGKQAAEGQGAQASNNIGAQDYQNNEQQANTWAQMAEQQQAEQTGIMENNANNAASIYGANQAANATLLSGQKTGVLGFLGL